MCTAWSASRTYGSSASASEYTATAVTPSRRAVRITRLAISPRLATSTESSIQPAYWGGAGRWGRCGAEARDGLELDDRAAVHYAAQSLDGVRVELADRV